MNFDCMEYLNQCATIYSPVRRFLFHVPCSLFPVPCSLLYSPTTRSRAGIWSAANSWPQRVQN